MGVTNVPYCLTGICDCFSLTAMNKSSFVVGVQLIALHCKWVLAMNKIRIVSPGSGELYFRLISQSRLRLGFPQWGVSWTIIGKRFHCGREVSGRTTKVRNRENNYVLFLVSDCRCKKF